VMAHFAEIDSNNIVLRVIVVADEHEANGAEWCNNLLGGTWVQTSYNNNIRKQYAGIGYTYNELADVFIQPQPFASWSLNANYDWQAPIDYPADGKHYSWDESNQVWVEFPAI
jgi:hypothetical protein